MKVRIKHISLVVVACVVVISANCIAASSVPSHLGKITKSTAPTYTGKAAFLAGKTSRPVQEPTDETRIIASSDGLAQGSVIPACLNILVLIAVLGSLVPAHVLKRTDPPLSESFSKILFRVIISPNAP